MKITVINLDRSRDRRREISSHLRELGLDFVLHKAVDGMAFPHEYEGLVDWRGSYRDGMYMKLGSVANWISQCQVLKDMVKSGPDVMTVLEDDAVPTAQFPLVLELLETMTDQFDILFLNFGPDRPFIPAANLPSGHQIGRLRWSHFGTQGYVITRRAAGVFLTAYPLARTGIDRALASYWRHGLKTLCLRPSVIDHAAHFQQSNSLKMQTPEIHWQDPLWRLRRGWFKSREGVAKRIAFLKIMVDEEGLVAGLRRTVWTRQQLLEVSKRNGC